MFLAAIHAAPEDDAPRLIYSDWLEENGQEELAEFIRIQIEMKQERERHEKITDKLDALFVRQRELFRRNWADVARHCGFEVIGDFRRGFPRQMYIPADAFIAFNEILGAWFGPETDVHLINLRGKAQALADQSGLGSLRRVEIGGFRDSDPHTDDDLVAFLQSPYLRNLEDFRLNPGIQEHGQRLTEQIVLGIAESPSLKKLRRLDLSRIPIRQQAASILANASRLSTLRYLDISCRRLSHGSIKFLTKSPYLERLETLVVEWAGMPERDRSMLIEHFGPKVLRISSTEDF